MTDATRQASGEGLRRRPLPAHYDWHVEPIREGDDYDDQAGIFEEEQLPRYQEYINIISDYVFWILLAYCAMNLLLWSGERLGLVSPQFEEWMPVRWWHSNPHGVQKELFENATSGAVTSSQFEGLKRWIESAPGGWVSPKLAVMDYLSERGRYERRLEVNEEVAHDEELLRLPISHVLSSDFCKQDSTDASIQQAVEAQKRRPEPVEIAPWTWLSFCMASYSRIASAGSFSESWRFNDLYKSEYVDAALSYIPVFWDDDSLHWLNGTDLLNVHVLDMHAAIETEYHKLSYLAPSILETLPIIEFKKSAMVVLSRGETLNLPDRENATRTVSQLTFMPLIDLLDHHLPMPEKPLLTDEDLLRYQGKGTRTNVSYDADLSAVVLRASGTIGSNSALTMAYGLRSNADYLLYHGFTMPREWSDLTLCLQHVLIELPLPTSMPVWKSRFLLHPYRFSVPACPNRKSTPHVIAGAARFLVATEDDVVGFVKRLQKDSSLLAEAVGPRDEKFLHHEAREALSVACDTAAEPPMCRAPLSLENERKTWALIRNQTLARVATHIKSVAEDEGALKDDDEKGQLSVNQRHAVIARREEKLALQRWCSVAMAVTGFLEGPGAEQELTLTFLPKEENLENQEPRARPQYWKRLLDAPPLGTDLPFACRVR